MIQRLQADVNWSLIPGEVLERSNDNNVHFKYSNAVVTSLYVPFGVCFFTALESQIPNVPSDTVKLAWSMAYSYMSTIQSLMDARISGVGVLVGVLLSRKFSDGLTACISATTGKTGCEAHLVVHSR